MKARAVILAAGRGERLGQLTAAQPKSLTMLGGRTLLQWKQLALAQAGIDEIYALTGYRAEAIAATGIRTLHNARWQTTNMIGTLLCADAVLSRPGRSLVCYGDVVFHPDIVAATLDAVDDIVIPYDRRWRELWAGRFADPLSDAESFAQVDGWLTDIGRRTPRADEIGGQFMGLLALSAPGWAIVRAALQAMPGETVDRLDTTALLRCLLAAGVRIRAVPVEGRWCEVDSASDLAVYGERMERGGWSHDWRWRSDDAG